MTPRVFIGFVLSDDDQYDSGDDLLEIETITIDRDEGEEESEQVSLPGAVAAGCYTLFVVADYYDVYAETNEANNAKGGLIAIGVPYSRCTGTAADLVVRDASVANTTPAPGERIDFSATLFNEGTAGAFDADISVLLSADDVRGASDEYLEFFYDDYVGPGSGVTVTESVRLPASTSSGTMYLLFVADYFSDVSGEQRGQQRRGSAYRSRRFLLQFRAYLGHDPRRRRNRGPGGDDVHGYLRFL